MLPWLLSRYSSILPSFKGIHDEGEKMTVKFPRVDECESEWLCLSHNFLFVTLSQMFDARMAERSAAVVGILRLLRRQPMQVASNYS